MPPERHQKRRRDWEYTMANYGVLPQELVESILSRLPVKSLVRFKSVCKQWYNLISDPYFIKLHDNHFSGGPESYKHDLLPWPSLGLNPTMEADYYEGVYEDHVFLGCCRGLICISLSVAGDTIVLWNPATRLWKTLPSSEAGFYNSSWKGIFLGFGCNDEGDDHKVVRNMYNELDDVVEVYSSKLDSWETMEMGFKLEEVHVDGQVAVVKGNPHGVITLKEAKEVALLRFDATNMSFKILGLPEVYHKHFCWPFVNWKGCVGLLERVEKEDGVGGLIKVWVYDEDGDTWSMNARIVGEGLRGIDWNSIVNYDWRNGKIVGQGVCGDMYAYDVENDSVKVYDNDYKSLNFGMLVYKESLAYVKGMTGDMRMGMIVGNENDSHHVMEGFLIFYVFKGLQVFYGLGI